MPEFAEDPTVRFARVAALTAPASPELAPSVLEEIIQKAGGDAGNQVTAVAEHVAANSGLSVTQAKPMVKAAVEGKTDDKEKAQAASAAVGGAVGAGAEVELSDPVMLTPPARVVFAGLFVVALMACIGIIAGIGKEANPQESALITLAVLGGLSLVAILVLVMGYKNVTIKGTGPSAGGSS